MSIDSELTRIENAKASLRTTLNSKGTSIGANDSIDTYSTAAATLQTLPSSGNAYYVELNDNYHKALVKPVDTTQTSITIAQETSLILPYACDSYTDLAQIAFPGNIPDVGAYAFRDCTSLTSATITGEYIGAGAFKNCSNLSNLSFSSAYYIGNEAFRGCSSLTGVQINAYYVGDFAFAECTSLIDFNFTNFMLHKIQQGMFFGCTSLASIIINSQIELLGDYVFGEWLELPKDFS